MYKHKSLIAPRAINADPQSKPLNAYAFSRNTREIARKGKKEKGKEEEEEERREKRRKKEIERDKRKDDRREREGKRERAGGGVEEHCAIR